MANRMTREERWGYAEYPVLTAQVTEKGKIACVDTASGLARNPSNAINTLIAIGYWETSTTGDGTTKVRIKLFREVVLHRFASTVSNPVVAANRLGICYLEDAETVTILATNRSVAGRVWDVTAAGILVEFGMGV